jgi:hypothetical protein
MPKWRGRETGLRLPVRESQSFSPIDRSIKGFPRATRAARVSWRRMCRPPMIADFSPAADPHVVAPAHMIEKRTKARSVRPTTSLSSPISAPASQLRLKWSATPCGRPRIGRSSAVSGEVRHRFLVYRRAHRVLCAPPRSRPAARDRIRRRSGRCRACGERCRC